jgi:DNA replication protein DnaC
VSDDPRRGPLGGLRATLPDDAPPEARGAPDPLGGALPGSGTLREGGEVTARASCPLGVCDGSGWIVGPEETARPCDCRRRRIERARVSGLRGTLPKRYRGVSFDRPPVSDMAHDPNPNTRATVRHVQDFCQSIDERLDSGDGAWLMGDVGTGKTSLAMVVSKTAMEAGRTVAVYSMPGLLARIRRTYDTDSGEEGYLSFFDRLTSVDLLHIDDLGAEKRTDWVLEQLYAIVDRRYSEERSMVVTTNLSDVDLAEQIGKRTVSRLIEMCGDPLPLYGADKREEHPDRGGAGLGQPS